LALRADDEALQGLRVVVEATAQIDPGVEAEEASDGDGVVCEPRQQHRNHRKPLTRLDSRNLAIKAELDLAVLPLPEAVWPDKRKKGAAGPEMLLKPGLPGAARPEGNSGRGRR